MYIKYSFGDQWKWKKLLYTFKPYIFYNFHYKFGVCNILNVYTFSIRAEIRKYVCEDVNNYVWTLSWTCVINYLNMTLTSTSSSGGGGVFIPRVAMLAHQRASEQSNSTPSAASSSHPRVNITRRQSHPINNKQLAPVKHGNGSSI